MLTSIGHISVKYIKDQAIPHQASIPHRISGEKEQTLNRRVTPHLRTIMNKLALVAVVILCTNFALGEGAVIIRKPGDSKSVAASSNTRVISILPSEDKNPKKRDSPALTMKEDVPLVERNKDRGTFSVNKRRPCTFCKFFTTVTPAPKPKMYFKFIQP